MSRRAAQIYWLIHIFIRTAYQSAQLVAVISLVREILIFQGLFPILYGQPPQDKILVIRSNGRYTRDYVYIDDIIDGYPIVAENLQRLKLAGKAFNLSYGDPLSVIRIMS